MGFFSGLSKSFGLQKDLNIEEFMSAAEAEEVDVLHEEADFYVKPIALQTDADLKIVEEELGNKNIILLNISPIARNAVKLKNAIAEIKSFVQTINGDMARIDEDKLLITPHNVKIVKRRH
ncbi:MAG: cell division protein SepF [Candidatus Micrarchaeota archaeon]